MLICGTVEIKILGWATEFQRLRRPGILLIITLPLPLIMCSVLSHAIIIQPFEQKLELEVFKGFELGNACFELHLQVNYLILELMNEFNLALIIYDSILGNRYSYPLKKYFHNRLRPFGNAHGILRCDTKLFFDDQNLIIQLHLFLRFFHVDVFDSLDVLFHVLSKKS